MEKGFGDLLKLSWREFLLKKSLLFKIIFYFYFIPAIVIVGVKIIGFISLGIPKIDLTNQATFALIPILGPFFIIAFVLQILMTMLLIFTSFEKNETTIQKLFKANSKRFWAFFGLNILLLILISLWSILLIIPGVIFGIYWALSQYVFLDKKAGAWESMKQSKKMIKGKWWKTLGYYFLMVLILVAISLIFSIPETIYELMSGEMIGLNQTQFIVLTILGLISSLATFVSTPLVILFFKNYYLELKTK